MQQDNFDIKSSSIVSFKAFDEEIRLFLPDKYDHIQRIIRTEKQFYEQGMLRDIYHRVAPGTMAIDVGAHIGNHSIFFSKICKLQVIALEPFLDSYKILLQNIKLNRLGSLVTALRKAAGNTRGRGEPLSANPLNTGMAGVEARPVGQVDIIPLDDLEFKTTVALLKIDVEGSELHVIKGATGIIERDRPLIYVEAENPRSRRALTAFLGPLGYSPVMKFNWTDTFLFMPCREPHERTNILMEELHRVSTLIKSEWEKNLAELKNLKNDGVARGTHLREEIHRLNSNIIIYQKKISDTYENIRNIEDRLEDQKNSINDGLSDLKKHTAVLKTYVGSCFERLEQRNEQIESTLVPQIAALKTKIETIDQKIEQLSQYNHNLAKKMDHQEWKRRFERLEQRNEQIESTLVRQIATLKSKIDLIDHKIEQLSEDSYESAKKIGYQGRKLGSVIGESYKATERDADEPDFPDNVILFDSSNGTWEGWRKHQKVQLGTDGFFEIQQNRSTPGIRRYGIPVNPGELYTFRVRGSVQAKNNKAFLWVMDSAQKILLCPIRYFKANREIFDAEIVFRTLYLTQNVDIGIMIADPHDHDICRLKTAELGPCSVEYAYPSVAVPFAEKIVASLASIPQRESILQDTVASLYPAVDHLRVFLNNYNHVPKFLLREKIEVCRSQDYGDNGDAGKFFWAGDSSEGYCFICDDDIVFPPDYVFRMVNKLNQYNNRAIVGIHGILLKQPLKNYYDTNSRHVTGYWRECQQDYLVHVLGTGAIAYHTESIFLNRESFFFRNMADIWLAVQAQKQQIPMISIKRDKNWIIILDGEQSKHNIYSHSTTGKNTALDTSLVQSHVVRKSYPFTIVLPSDTRRKRLKLVLGVTTYNRLSYLQACLESFLNTRNTDYDWVVIVADDGSTDGTLEYLDDLTFPTELHILKNNRRYACGQTNTIFQLSQEISFHVGFKVDDDLVFLKRGWDDLYLRAMEESGWEHLVYRNSKVYTELRKREEPDFEPESPTIDRSGSCEALADVNMCLGTGPFFTFTPNIIRHVGYTDEANFPIRGQWHVDYHIRCCRARFNDADHLYDAIGSNEYLDVQNNISEQYRCAIPWGEEYAKTKEPAELARRQRVMDDISRVYISAPKKIEPPCQKDINGFFDKIYVLNLDRRPDRWEKVRAQAEKNGIRIHRFPAVDGMEEPHRSEWESYFRQDLVTHPTGIRKINTSFEYLLDYDSDIARVAYLEKRNKKKAIQTPGAWGYLKTMILILEKAIKEDLESMLVLDDDVLFHKNISELFAEFIRQVPQDWKILQLGTLQYHWGEKWITWVSKNVYRCNGTSIASHAVGMHYTTFPLLLNQCYKFNLPYDEGPLHKAKKVFASQSFTFYPNLIIQNTAESDINSSNVQEKEGRKKDNVYRWNLDDYPLPKS